MVKLGETLCPRCRNPLSYYDTVRRIVRSAGRATHRAYIRRLRCEECGSLHRELPNFIFPYKQYRAEIIRGVIVGLITPETEGCEEYPCEGTMRYWRTRKLHGLL